MFKIYSLKVLLLFLFFLFPLCLLRFLFFGSTSSFYFCSQGIKINVTLGTSVKIKKTRMLLRSTQHIHSQRHSYLPNLLCYCQHTAIWQVPSWQCLYQPPSICFHIFWVIRKSHSYKESTPPPKKSSYLRKAN